MIGLFCGFSVIGYGDTCAKPFGAEIIFLILAHPVYKM